MRPRLSRCPLLSLCRRGGERGALGLALTLLTASATPADPFADAVVDFSPGVGAGFGQGHFPANVLGAPEGGPTDFLPQEQPQHLLSLGHGGQITVEFIETWIADGPGVDFLVFENPLINPVNGDPFIECATVEVSLDGVDWRQMPFDFIPPEPPEPPNPAVYLAENYLGFAGVTPVRSSSTNGVDPADPAVAGGDGFDLAAVGLTHARLVRITDGGLGSRTDGDGDVLADDGDFGAVNSGINRGFDLDAVVAVHEDAPSGSAGWEVYR